MNQLNFKTQEELKNIVLGLKDQILPLDSFVGVHLIMNYPLKGLRPVLEFIMVSGYSIDSVDLINNLLEKANVNTFEQTSFSAGNSTLTKDTLIFGDFIDFDLDYTEKCLWMNAVEMRYHEEF